MNNGSLVLCKKIVISDGGLLSLVGVKYYVNQGVGEEVDIYVAMYPEKIGPIRIEIRLSNKTRGTSKMLFYSEEFAVRQTHMSNGIYPMILEHVPIFIGDSDKYAVDVFIDDMPCVSATLNVVPMDTSCNMKFQ